MQRYEPTGPTDPPPTTSPRPSSSYKPKKNGSKAPSEVVIDPDRPKKSSDDIREAKESTAVFTFGRFNPPTVGHEKLIKKVEDTAREHGGKPHIFASHSENKSKDPLPQAKKIGYIKKVASKGTKVQGSSREMPNFLHIAKKLHQDGHQHLVMVAGDDRVEEYKNRLERYNGHPDHFNFKSIKVVSAGKRDPDAEGVEGMSGTKMRSLARTGKHSEFKAGLPKAIHPHAKEIADHIRSIPEETLIEGQVASIRTRLRRALTATRDKAKLALARKLASSRLGKGPQLKRRAQKIARKLMRMRSAGSRGAAYNKLSMSDKISLDTMIKDKSPIIQRIAKRLLPRVKTRDVQRLSGRQMSAIPMMNSYVNHYKQIIKESGLEENFIDSVMAKILAEKAADTPVSLRAYRETNTKEKKKLGIPIARLGQVNKEEIEPKDLLALEEKANESGISVDTLRTIFNRGMKVAKTFKPKGSTAQQTAFARVNSFINKGRSFKEMDKDLADIRHRHQQIKKKVIDE